MRIKNTDIMIDRNYFYIFHHLARLFYLLDYVTCRHEKIEISKKKKINKRILPDTTVKSFVFGVTSEIIKKIY